MVLCLKIAVESLDSLCISRARTYTADCMCMRALTRYHVLVDVLVLMKVDPGQQHGSHYDCQEDDDGNEESHRKQVSDRWRADIA